MEFELIKFELYDDDGIANINFVIETKAEIIIRNKPLTKENQEDVTLLRAIETFINTKGEKNNV